MWTLGVIYSFIFKIQNYNAAIFHLGYKVNIYNHFHSPDNIMYRMWCHKRDDVLNHKCHKVIHKTLS